MGRILNGVYVFSKESDLYASKREFKWSLKSGSQFSTVNIWKERYNVAKEWKWVKCSAFVPWGPHYILHRRIRYSFYAPATYCLSAKFLISRLFCYYPRITLSRPVEYCFQDESTLIFPSISFVFRAEDCFMLHSEKEKSSGQVRSIALKRKANSASEFFIFALYSGKIRWHSYFDRA